jgi:hypothetical protein
MNEIADDIALLYRVECLDSSMVDVTTGEAVGTSITQIAISDALR